LITVLIIYIIPEEAKIETIKPRILSYIIIATSLIITRVLIYNKKRSTKSIKIVNNTKVETVE